MKFRVPATTGNTGPGFDSVGLAFTLYARFEAELLPAGQLAISGCEAKYQNEENLAVQAFRAVEKRLGVRPAGLKLHIDTDVPISRGLGSSATLLAAGAFAANALHGAPLDKEMLLDVTTQMEGHPDNAAPALYGGLCASVVGEDGRVLCVRYPVAPSVRFAALIPDFPLATAEARRVLPASIPRADAVFNISRTAILMRGMEMGDYVLLSAALDDRLHTPYRKALIHDFDFVRAQALEAGARALVISGAGPTPRPSLRRSRRACPRSPTSGAPCRCAWIPRVRWRSKRQGRARTDAAQCHMVFRHKKTASHITGRSISANGLCTPNRWTDFSLQRQPQGYLAIRRHTLHDQTCISAFIFIKLLAEQRADT